MKHLRNRSYKPSIKVRSNLIGWAFVLPAMAGFVLLNLLPMIISAYYSFCEYNIVGKPQFIGIGNYLSFFNGSDPLFLKSVRVTLYYAVLAVPSNILFSFCIAILLNRKMIGRAFFRSVFYLPSIVPAVASGFVWLLLMNPDFGLLNKILEFFRLPSSNWLWGEKSVIPSIVFMGIWGTGSTQVIFLAGLQNIPRVYYEAAEIDGGSAWQKFWHITLPMVSSTLFFNLILGIIGALQVFNQAYIMTEGGPNNASMFYAYNLWRRAFRYMEMGKASAMAWIMFLVVVLLTAAVFRTSNKWVYYEGGD